MIKILYPIDFNLVFPYPLVPYKESILSQEYLIIIN